MSAAAGMAIVLSVFFLGGVTVGIIAVIAISARKDRHDHSPPAPGKTIRGDLTISPPGQSRRRAGQSRRQRPTWIRPPRSTAAAGIFKEPYEANRSVAASEPGPAPRRPVLHRSRVAGSFLSGRSGRSSQA
jgi:hypothetical protein